MKAFYNRHQEKINYLVVGGWNTVVGYLTFVGLYLLFHQRINYVVLLVVSNLISITNAYVGYKVFVFRTKGNYLREYLRFYFIYGLILLLNLVLLPLIVELFKVNPVIAQGIIMFLNVILSFLGNKHFSFRPKRS